MIRSKPLDTDPQAWQTEQSEYLFREPWLTVRRDQVLLSNGHRIPAYYVLEYPDWVNVIGITTNNEFVLVRQYRHALGVTHYELCAGVADETDAHPLESARRELLEETGYGGGQWQEWMVFSPNPATQTNLTYCYLATGLERIAEPSPEASEEISVHLLSEAEVRELLIQGQIIQALHVAPLWKYFAVRDCGSTAP